jgi:hypothetical protein
MIVYCEDSVRNDYPHVAGTDFRICWYRPHHLRLQSRLAIRILLTSQEKKWFEDITKQGQANVDKKCGLERNPI